MSSSPRPPLPPSYNSILTPLMVLYVVVPPRPWPIANVPLGVPTFVRCRFLRRPSLRSALFAQPQRRLAGMSPKRHRPKPAILSILHRAFFCPPRGLFSAHSLLRHFGTGDHHEPLFFLFLFVCLFTIFVFVFLFPLSLGTSRCGIPFFLAGPMSFTPFSAFATGLRSLLAKKDRH
ncbi:hypothetical protein MAPG_01282 [Magnaporthiopsis poae ATCC 64411]|uniref:Transmembrane protein n=1 Tax=Magnaporthiopsis poae (strain ATCC 64411 / 73-15) TaxID=644358 RepID=A0A0C4DNA1_MAGP6|nr:hypothetical protein MAPG_01282 [Magnaporthiopsis poae ATCC 64411]